ncbi:Por secretion system C-terminal sorting domain-containing protein [Marivirga sericea]|uniref:Por secretion system C-terminal sorting domain-containing protein n=1 Tax=Marivirga sericea TaxID=1028 RepID=A0A1X7IFU0_9BACT|nr:BspA family leucine-rich repeat surface protein [Marivirga sericea]SMG13641.1 Por secretion system C-terminal sorting domain-containing protein [Marivirga sericea]
MKNLILLLLFKVIIFQSAFSQEDPRPFITTWNIPSEGSFNIPLSTSQIYDFEFFVIQESDTLFSGVHTSADGDFSFGSIEPDTVALHIYGAFPHFTGYSKSLLLDVLQWGDIVWESMFQTFNDWRGTGFSATDAPDLSQVTDMAQMFFRATSFNDDLSDWDVSNVEAMNVMFRQATVFNQDLSAWDLRNVTTTAIMFENADAFNQDLSTWNVSNVNNMTRMFDGADSFNGDISTWDVSNVTNMERMFQRATSFNTDISDWQVGNVTNMRDMLNGALVFNQDISSWDVSRVTNMNEMLRRTAFNQDISSWDVSRVTDMRNMFQDTNLSSESYDQILIGWSALPNLRSNVPLGAPGVEACEGEVARFFLRDQFGWNITDGGTCDQAENILSFEIANDQIGEEVIDYVSHSITLRVFPETDLTTLTPQIALSEGATSEPADEAAQDFTNPVIYAVTAEDGETAQNWTITVEASEQLPFITSWSTVAGESITIELNGSFAYNFDYTWKDSGGNELTSGRHTSADGDFVTDFTATEEATLEITGNFPHLENYSKSQLLDVQQWGEIEWASMASTFQNWPGTGFSATDDPDLSNVTNMSLMFRGAANFDDDINDWQVGKVTNMSDLFLDAVNFNSNISDWDVSSVTNMSRMFFRSDAFNQDLSEWGVSQVRNMREMFSGAESFTSDLSGWNVNVVTSLEGLFRGASNFNSDLNDWDVSQVTNMAGVFQDAQSFNGNIGTWNVENVTDMESMFDNADAFNQDLNEWNVGNVRDMSFMFRNSSGFNGNISTWNVENVNTMFRMFQNASAFNQDLTNWNPASLNTMFRMFDNANSFNGDISTWNVESVTNMAQAFVNADSFNQDLSGWDVSSVTTMTNTFNGTSLTPQNYDQILIAWTALEGLQPNVSLGASGITFCKSAAARAILTDPEGLNWEIEDDGQFCLDETVITFFDSNLENGLGIIKGVEGVISLAVTESTDVSSIASTIKLSPGATISPERGVPVDLNNVVYTVTAEDGITTQDYAIEVTGPRFITTWVVEGDEGIKFEGSEEGFDYDFDYIIVDANNTDVTSGSASSFDDIFPLEAGEYHIEITGEFPHFAGYPVDQLLDVLQWGDIEWKSMKFSFQGWEGTTFSATDAPDLSLVTDMTGMFENAFNFNGNLSNWDFSAIEDMNLMFYNAIEFNGNLSEWNVSSVTNMQEMFATDTGEPMAFNSNISSWDVGKVANMAFMFNEASLFNRDLSSWDVSSLEAGAGTGADGIFNGAGLSPQNYDKTLIGWAAQEVKDNVTLGADGITFCKGSKARQSLIDDHNWIIDDAGSFCSSETDILSFTIEGQFGGTSIDEVNHTISLSMPFATDLSALVPDFELSVGALASPASSEIVDFSGSVIYTITAEDGITTQNWEVSVTEARNTATDIETVFVNTENEDITIDAANPTVNIRFAFGTDITAVPVAFAYSEGATSNIGESGTFDLTNPLVITVTAQDGITTQEWTIRAAFASNKDTDIEAAVVNVENEEVTINDENHTVNILFAFGTDITAIPIEFSNSEGATSNIGESGTFDLTNPLFITITAQDGITTQEWIISAEIALNTATDIVGVTIDSETEQIVIDTENRTVKVLFTNDSDLSAVTMNFSYSEGANSNVGEGGIFDLTVPLTISVTAQDGSTTELWTLTATKKEEVLGINEKRQEVKFYPNPVLDILYVQSSVASTIYLIDLDGRRVTTQKKGNQIWLDVSDIEPGVYFLIVELNQNKTLQRIIKK